MHAGSERPQICVWSGKEESFQRGTRSRSGRLRRCRGSPLASQGAKFNNFNGRDWLSPTCIVRPRRVPRDTRALMEATRTPERGQDRGGSPWHWGKKEERWRCGGRGSPGGSARGGPPALTTTPPLPSTKQTFPMADFDSGQWNERLGSSPLSLHSPRRSLHHATTASPTFHSTNLYLHL